MNKLCLSIITGTIIFSGNTFAINLELYENPKESSKKIGKINSEKGFIPIFKTKDKKWIKIGDPSNGNVGWIKASDMNLDSKNGYTISEQIVTHGSGPGSYIIKFGEPLKISDEKTKKYYKEMQKRQQEIQKDMLKMMEDSFEYFNKFTIEFPTMKTAVIEKKPALEKIDNKTTADQKK